jgi:hypothetical protein
MNRQRSITLSKAGKEWDTSTAYRCAAHIIEVFPVFPTSPRDTPITGDSMKNTAEKSLSGKNFGTSSTDIKKFILEYCEKKGYAPMSNATVGIRGRTVKRRVGNPVGSGDVLACVRGVWFEFEVKAAGDRQSEAQHLREAKIKRAGGLYFIVPSIERFLEITEQHGL